ncbi:isochorismatase family protein [Parvularcula marina]|nr:isochorismatase family protein [Parvularcula marina]
MTAGNLDIDPTTTALLVVDLQNFTVGFDTHPTPGAQVLKNAVALADACRKQGMHVVLVRVGHGGAAKPPNPDIMVEEGFASSFQLTDEMVTIPEVLGPKEGDLVVDKYNWGAFHGTNLDTHLRRRGIRTLIVTGLVTEIGVDTTAREAYAHNYSQILVSDGMGGFTPDAHDYVLQTIFPRLGLVRSTKDVLAALG